MGEGIRPHPGPLLRGEGETFAAVLKIHAAGFIGQSSAKQHHRLASLWNHKFSITSSCFAGFTRSHPTGGIWQGAALPPLCHFFGCQYLNADSMYFREPSLALSRSTGCPSNPFTRHRRSEKYSDIARFMRAGSPLLRARRASSIKRETAAYSASIACLASSRGLPLMV